MGEATEFEGQVEQYRPIEGPGRNAWPRVVYNIIGST